MKNEKIVSNWELSPRGHLTHQRPAGNREMAKACLARFLENRKGTSAEIEGFVLELPQSKVEIKERVGEKG